MLATGGTTKGGSATRLEHTKKQPEKAGSNHGFLLLARATARCPPPSRLKHAFVDKCSNYATVVAAATKWLKHLSIGHEAQYYSKYCLLHNVPTK